MRFIGSALLCLSIAWSPALASLGAAEAVAAPMTPDKDAHALSDYADFLSRLGTKNPGAGQAGLVQLRTRFGQAPEDLRDAAAAQYMRFFIRFARRAPEAPCPRFDEKTARYRDTPAIAKERASKGQSGIDFLLKGACYVAIERPGYLQQILGPLVSPGGRDYLRLHSAGEKASRLRESIDPQDEKSLLKLFEELARLIIELDAYKSKFPNSKYIDFVKERYDSFLNDFLFGNNNSLEIFSRDSEGERVLRPSIRAIQQRVERTNPTTATGQLLRKYSECLARSQGQLGPELQTCVGKLGSPEKK